MNVVEQIEAVAQAPRVTVAAIKSAKSWAEVVHGRAPIVAANDSGEIVFEWWNKSKSLVVYFDEVGVAAYVQAPSSDVSTMLDGTLADQQQLTELLRWLNA